MGVTDRLTAREVAQALRIHEETLRRWCRTGKIAFIRVGRDYRFDPSVLSPRACAAEQEDVCQSAEGVNAGSWISTRQA